MEAQTLNCPMCGASSSSDATKCGHCGARLATTACPSCFGLMFHGQKFCPHCGGLGARSDVEAPSLSCPKCKIEMTRLNLAKTSLSECSQCEGLWVDVASFEQICADREEQGAVLGSPLIKPLSPMRANDLQNIRYVKCPECHEFMNRVNFARCSGVILDVCRRHGSWFDRDELRRIVEFIRGGGMSSARDREIRDLKEEQRRLASLKRNRNIERDYRDPSYDPAYSAIEAAGELLGFFFNSH